MKLRDYQLDLINNIKKSLLKGNQNIVAVLGCGGGKSVIQGELARKATIEKHNQVLFLVHRKELKEQIYETFKGMGVDMVLCNTSMVQTFSRKVDTFPKDYYKMIITDEAHHSTAKTYRKIYDHFADAVKLGFTATPVRLNQGGLGEVYTDLIKSVSTKWLIAHHYLAPYRYFSIRLADTSGLHIQNGDFNQKEVAELMENDAIYGDTVGQWERIAKDKKTIVYCASVKSAEETAQAFKDAGYTACAISGNTPKQERSLTMDKFRAGDIKVLTNCELFGEGLDVPDCECVVLLRPTQSLSLYIQQSMRSMRYKEGKTAIIIDHVYNVARFGLPDDDREWSLAPKKKQENTVKIRECSECFAVFAPNLSKCPYCGAEAKKEIRKASGSRKVVDVDLVEIKRQDIIKNTRLQDAELHTWEEIVEFQKLHKYKFMWALRYAIDHEIPYPKKYAYMVHKFIKQVNE